MALEEIRNLLIVGRTCSGKSTLANVLSNTNDFAESESSISIKEASKFKKEVFESEGLKYCVVGIIGLDIRLAGKEVFSIPEKINQVLFVVDGRFMAEEVE